MAVSVEKLVAGVVAQKTKFIVVTGGVCSSLGKGVLISSIGTLLKNAGYSVSVIKCDPYLNVDPGTMSPLVHGEVFVTDDGAETDMDLGHYERILGVRLSKMSSVSSGQIYQEVLDGERKGEYLGRCIQLVPHVVNAFKRRLLNFAILKKADFVLIEIGGTVGDMEGEFFLEAIRELRMQLAVHQMFHAHLSYVPYLEWSNELKTKPTQHSVMLLKWAGLIPDSLFLRTDHRVDAKSVEKLSIMCGVEKDLIFQGITHKPIYKLFVDLAKQGVHIRLQEWFGFRKIKETDLTEWKKLISLIEKKKDTFKIGLIAKYVGSSEPYISVLEAIRSGAYANKCDVEIVDIEAEMLEKNDEKAKVVWKKLKSVDGIVMPGGFDNRGVEGKIAAVEWARKNNVPYLGLCLGLQVMLIEFARSVLKLKDASSTEFDKKAKDPIIALLEEQEKVTKKGASMRLGAFECTLTPDSIAGKAYGQKSVMERHRHRYEFNNAYRESFKKEGILFSGVYKERDLIEIAEYTKHPFMLGSQFHPEFLSTPLRPHPLFKAFIKAVVARKKD